MLHADMLMTDGLHFLLSAAKADAYVLDTLRYSELNRHARVA